MTLPPPECNMAGMAYLQQRKILVRLTSRVLSHTDKGVSTGFVSFASLIPALLNKTLIPDKALSASMKMALQLSALETSPVTETAWPPEDFISSTVWRPASPLMSTAQTVAPSSAKRIAATFPIPRPAPVIRAFLP